MDKILDFTFGGLTNRVIDVLEWWYDRDVRDRRYRPFGG